MHIATEELTSAMQHFQSYIKDLKKLVFFQLWAIQDTIRREVFRVTERTAFQKEDSQLQSRFDGLAMGRTYGGCSQSGGLLGSSL